MVTDRGALPEVVGDIGFKVPYGDIRATADAIKDALRSCKGKAAREWVVRNFSVKSRKIEFISEIEKALT